MTRLTRTEAAAHGQLMAEHRARKCHRCQHREDIDGWEMFGCRKGQSVTLVMAGGRNCKKWALDENRENWLD